MVEKRKILFICTHNSARSQMAEGVMKALYGDQYDVSSAGTHPSKVHPYATRVMREIGINISDQRSKSIHEFLGKEFDDVVTVCDQARESCPFFPGAKSYFHRTFKDPALLTGAEEEILDTFRKVRDEIVSWIRETFRS